MQVRQSTFGDFISGPITLLTVPYYHRPYCWGPQEYGNLLQGIWQNIRWNTNHGLVSAIQTPVRYFIGSIVLQRISDDSEWMFVIDGQQRIMTLMLLLRALCDFVPDNHVRNRIADDYLLHKYRDGDRQYRFKPLDEDRTAFIDIINSEKSTSDEFGLTDELRSTSVYRCYQSCCSFLNEKVVREEGDFGILLQYILGIQIVQVEMTADDENVQTILSTLNTSGLVFSPMDCADIQEYW